MKIKVAVGLSGGVDSAVSAALLLRAGYEVVGVYLHCFPENFQKTLDCTDKEDFKSAQEAAKTLRIPFTFYDFEDVYQEKVIEYFFREYQAGRTPNPDAVCNKEIKFGLFLEKALEEMRVDFVATGHYTRIENGALRSGASSDRFFNASVPAARLRRASGYAPPVAGSRENLLRGTPSRAPDSYHLFAGYDLTKDQSYFLYSLSQEQLSHILFPVGEYTKKEVRQMAKDFGLPNWQRKDSQGICFLGKISVRKFLEQRIKPKKGEVVDTSRRVIGEHDGVWFYTIGQRHGFRINFGALRSGVSDFFGSGDGSCRSAAPRVSHTANKPGAPAWGSPPRVTRRHSEPPHFNGPWYVVEKDVKNNRLIVGWGKECEKKEFEVGNVNWINGKGEKVRNCRVRIRHLGELYPCRLKVDNHRIEVKLIEPAWGVAPGQIAVFYSPRGGALRGDGEEVLGGGVIV